MCDLQKICDQVNDIKRNLQILSFNRKYIDFLLNLNQKVVLLKHEKYLEIAHEAQSILDTFPLAKVPFPNDCLISLFPEAKKMTFQVKKIFFGIRNDAHNKNVLHGKSIEGSEEIPRHKICPPILYPIDWIVSQMILSLFTSEKYNIYLTLDQWRTYVEVTDDNPLEKLYF
jgi:hypothetical protein